MRKRSRCIDISCYSNHWEQLLGWRVDRGSKITQGVSIPTWIKERKEYVVPCLRGLFETDGSIYVDRGYPMAMFANACEPLAHDVAEALTTLGFRPRIYRVDKNRRRAIYRVRLSRNVPEFVTLVRPRKS